MICCEHDSGRCNTTCTTNSYHAMHCCKRSLHDGSYFANDSICLSRDYAKKTLVWYYWEIFYYLSNFLPKDILFQIVPMYIKLKSYELHCDFLRSSLNVSHMILFKASFSNRDLFNPVLLNIRLPPTHPVHVTRNMSSDDNIKNNLNLYHQIPHDSQ